jgi:hypothetical protein
VGFAPGDLPQERHASYAASTSYRFGTFTLWIHEFLQASRNEPFCHSNRERHDSTTSPGTRPAPIRPRQGPAMVSPLRDPPSRRQDALTERFRPDRTGWGLTYLGLPKHLVGNESRVYPPTTLTIENKFLGSPKVCCTVRRTTSEASLPGPRNRSAETALRVSIQPAESLQPIGRPAYAGLRPDGPEVVQVLWTSACPSRR